MARFFNKAGPWRPEMHYMLPAEERLPGHVRRDGIRRAADRLRARIRDTQDSEERQVLEQQLQDLLAQYDPSDQEIDGSLFLAG